MIAGGLDSSNKQNYYYYSTLIKKIHSYDLEDNITILTNISDIQKMQLLNDSIALVYPV